jgi:hypothetical protein
LTVVPAGTPIDAVLRHAAVLVDDGTDRYGTEHTPMFMATLDPATRRYPADDTRPATFVQRAYRFIHAPRGCAAYWDQPTLAALELLAEHTGETRFAAAVRDYLAFFAERCVAANGLFLWGNHYYWDAFQDRNVGFTGGERLFPVDPAAPGTLHEMRPLFPAWETLWRVAAPAVERHLRACAEWHFFDAAAGAFNRHADKQRGCAFLESAGILVHGWCFLYAKTGDAALLDPALRLARYCFSHRNEATDLLVNNPTETRWDGRMTTTEVGLWAHALFRGGALLRSGDGGGGGGEAAAAAAAALEEMGRRALAAYLRHGFDATAGRYFGRLNLDGTPNREARETPYMPGEHSSVWEFLFPTHDYPMSTGMAALDCLERGDAEDATLFGEGATRLADAAAAEWRAWPDGQVRYAEHYGRIAVYLAEFARITGREPYRELAAEVAAEALRKLERDGMLVGRTNATWYDAIDGVGYLLLAVLYLRTGDRRALEAF